MINEARCFGKSKLQGAVKLAHRARGSVRRRLLEEPPAFLASEFDAFGLVSSMRGDRESAAAAIGASLRHQYSQGAPVAPARTRPSRPAFGEIKPDLRRTSFFSLRCKVAQYKQRAAPCLRAGEASHALGPPLLLFVSL